MKYEMKLNKCPYYSTFYFEDTRMFNGNSASIKLNITVHLSYELLVNTAGPPSLSTAIFCTWSAHKFSWHWFIHFTSSYFLLQEQKFSVDRYSP